MKLSILQAIIFIFILAGCGQSLDPNEITEAEEESTSTFQAEEESGKSTEMEDASEEVEAVEEAEAASAHHLQNLEVHYIDAGQGDATLFLYSDENESYAILYDTGDWTRNDVINYLNQLDISSIDLVVG